MTESMQEILYTEAFIRRVARQTIVRNLGLLYLIAMLCLSASISIGIVLGSRDWFFGLTTTVFALGIIVPLPAHEASKGKLAFYLFVFPSCWR